MYKYYVADAFAEKAFEGNPAGVCVLEEWLPLEKMAKIAMENNLSETGFVVKESSNPCTYGLRWFTPTGEIDLCGHCTFGTAYILFRFYEEGENTIHFNTKKCGYHLTVEKQGEVLTMDFPSIPPEAYEYADYMGEGIGAIPSEVYRTERDLILVYDSAETVKNLQPDFSKVRQFPVGLSVYVTAKAEDGVHDFVARAFWPKINVNEDPVCGSMHCALTPFWKGRLGKERMSARSLSQRGGTVYCQDCGERVKISGKGALYSIGHILVDE